MSMKIYPITEGGVKPQHNVIVEYSTAQGMWRYSTSALTSRKFCCFGRPTARINRTKTNDVIVQGLLSKLDLSYDISDITYDAGGNVTYTFMKEIGDRVEDGTVVICKIVVRYL